jgi:Cys-tRNA(Pro)/Cys-tRNA(Cys) deacylase
MKTNAVRLLEEMGVRYELRAYEVDPDDLTAETVADKIGLPAEQVFKTLAAAATATASASRWRRATAGST